MKRIGVVAILLLAFCGLVDSLYLTQHELSGTPLLCNTQGLVDCNTVVSSHYAHLFGVPVAGLGVIFFVVVFAMALFELFVFDTRVRRAIQLLAVIGISVSLVFMLIQLFLIEAFCLYCLASGAITFFLFLIASVIEPLTAPVEQHRLVPLIPTLPIMSLTKQVMRMPPAP